MEYSTSFPSSSAPFSTTPKQAWAILNRHAKDDIQHLRLQELCGDDDRVSSLVSVYKGGSSSSEDGDVSGGDDSDSRMIMVDISRQRMTLETLNHLLRLAASRKVTKFIRQVAWGPNDPDNPIIPCRIRIKGGKELTPDDTSSSKGKKSSHNHSHHNQNYKIQPICRIPSYHLALRVPSGLGLEMLDAEGTNVLPGIHSDWERIRRFSESIRFGKLPGVTGGMIKDVVVVGRGTAVMALRFVYLALCKDEAATIGRRVGLDGKGHSQRRIKFLTSVDPVRAAACVADSDPASTLVVSIALTSEEETFLPTQTLQNWLLTNLGGHGRRQQTILSKHMVLVTANDDIACKHKPESTFVIPHHSRREPFTTFTAIGLLPLSIIFGWPIVEEFLAGAHDMDSHFVETNPRHNLPVLLALIDIWNGCLSLHDSESLHCGRIVSPFTEAFAGYPAFVAEIEAQACGRNSHSHFDTSMSCSCTVIDGGLHGVYDRSLYQSDSAVSSELVMTLNSQLAVNADPRSSSQGGGSMDDVYEAQDSLVCSLFAHADGLAFGSVSRCPTLNGSSSRSDIASAGYNMFASTVKETLKGNRPSTLLLCGKLDAFACGQLVAMAEHRAVVKAWICEIDPFPRDVGTSLRAKRTESLMHSLRSMIVAGEEMEQEDDVRDGISDMNLSTKTILQHYANLFRHERVYTVKR